MAGGDQARFSEEETALILRRASRAEVRRSSLPSGGHTLEELVSIADEAGFDVDAVRAAARVVPPRPDPVQKVMLGAPSGPVVRARFPGTLPEARVPVARDALETALGRSGHVTSDPTGFLWREDHGLGRSYVRVRREGGVTEVEVEAERKGHLLVLMLVLATLVAILLQPLGGFAGLSGVMGPLLAVLAPVGMVAGATRLLWPRLARPTVRRLEEAAMEVGRLVEPDPPDDDDPEGSEGDRTPGGGSAERPGDPV